MFVALLRLGSFLASSVVMAYSIGNAEARSSQLIWECQHKSREAYIFVEIQHHPEYGYNGKLTFEDTSAQLVCAESDEKFQCLGFWNPIENMERVEMYSLNLKNGMKSAVFMAPQDYGKKEISLICQRRGKIL